ncbi:hypothetical protein I3U44_17155 [Mycobacteroides abscessus subsp. bolletii]|uniref:hypothetical protein n=1 Tax=Mycobacteroides abscessus TaxID=36809 RepID=UPI0019D2E7AD|nr:hypothetical protein [Mycobacteroides abscessus]QSM87557.1 hypothetical protein I3U44_17155 [Mycobacteroides abscessus subsp. bolletii]
MSSEVAEKLIAKAEANGHNLHYSDEYGLLLDHDAMEWMDFFWDDWPADVLNDPSVNGDVVFICAEGDQAGEIWGYRFKEGQMVKLASTIRLRETRN